VGINNSTNAGLLAVRMLGVAIPEYRVRMQEYMDEMEQEVMTKVERLEQVGWEEY